MKRILKIFRAEFFAGLMLVWGASLEAAGDTVSYYHDLVPILKRSCTGCHHPGKLKGELDLTSFAALSKGGKHGPIFKGGDAKHSELIEQIAGAEPSMPKEGDALSAAEVALFEKWINAGAVDDTPPEAANPFKLSKPPVYSKPPVISAMALSPDGKLLAVSGYHEVLLHHADGSGLVARLVGESPRIEAVAFSPNGKWLGVAGGAPARFGEIQIWDATTHQEVKSYKISPDSLYGISFSPDSERVAVGGADKSVRILSVADGKESMKFDNHSDWVFGTTFTRDGKKVLSGSRDRAMKLIDAQTGQFIDDINKLLEGVLCLARSPKDDLVVYGGDMGTPRLYRISDNQNRGSGDTARDANLVKEFERQPGAIRAVAYSADGSMIAVCGAAGEARVYKSDGTKVATLKGMEGYTFSLLFNPEQTRILAGGFDGRIRIYDLPSGKMATNFIPVEVTSPAQVAARP